MATKSSSQYLGELEAMGKSMPQFQQELAKAYQDPVLKPLTNEAANLEGQYLTNLFQPFAEMGTGAADLSPAAKLAAMGGSMGRLGGRISANNAIQNFFGAQVNDLANTLSNQWMSKRQSLTDLYDRSFQREQAQKQAAAQAAAQRAAADAARQQQEALKRLLGGGKTTAATPSIKTIANVPRETAQVIASRVAPAVSSALQPQNVANLWNSLRGAGATPVNNSVGLSGLTNSILQAFR